MLIGALNTGMSLRYVECGKEWLRAPMMGNLHAVCADFEEMRRKLRAFDWLVASSKG